MRIQEAQVNHESDEVKHYGYETLMLSSGEQDENKANIEDSEFTMSCYCDCGCACHVTG